MTDDKKPISSEDMILKLANIIKNGMAFDTKITDQKRDRYKADLVSFIAETPYYTAFYDSDTMTIMVETSYFDPLICVDITNSGIFFLPLTEKGYYRAFMKVIEFFMLQEKKLKEEEQQEEIEVEPKEIPNFDFL
tara:strand:+ start:159 stop:563 length:405 start_codon:yes stop_codon:yes gene_type:complete